MPREATRRADGVDWWRRLGNTAYVGARAGVERRVPFWPAGRIELLQRRRLQAIVRHAYATVPFYRETMRQRGLEPKDFRSVADLALLPLLDDLTVRREPERFASNRYHDSSRLVVHTSGSTSHVQKLLYWNHGALLARMAIAERDRAVINSLAGRGWGQRQLYIFPPDSMAVLLREFWDAATLKPPRIADRHFLPVDLPFDELLRNINALKPQVVFSYGSHADQFFRWLADRRLRLAAPRVWMYGGDTLSPAVRELMEKEYGCLVYSTYQAGETGRIGFECERRRGFHVNVDTVAVRLVDATGETVPPGASGEVVISNLYNRAMVLLNYRLGDRAAWSGAPCPCGRSLPLLDLLEGRCSDVLQLADGRTVPEGIFTIILEDQLRETIQCQFTQSTTGHLCFRVVPTSGADLDALRKGIVARSRVVLGPTTELTVEFVSHIERERSGKFRRVIHGKPPA